MKTTSSRDPNEIMAEIKKVTIYNLNFISLLLFHCNEIQSFPKVLDANNCDYEQRERFLLLCVHGDPNTDSLVQVNITLDIKEVVNISPGLLIICR